MKIELLLTVLVCIVVAAESALAPYFPVTENSEVFVQDGDHIGLKCIPEGDPKPTVSWHLPSGLNPNSPVIDQHIRYHFANIELEIINMTRALEGTYVCLATDKQGTASLTYSVKYGSAPTAPPLVLTTPPTGSPPPVIMKPEVFLTHTEYNATEGDPILAVPCAADGLPIPTIDWSVLGARKPPNVVQYQNFLIIRNVTLENNHTYKCNASNSEGWAAKTVQVYVRPKPHVKPTASMVPSTFVKYGQSTTLKCTVSGYPDPDITWYFNGKVLPEKTTTVTIQNAKLTDMGTYSCSAKNDAGNSTAHTVFFVQGTSPSITRPPDQLVTVTPKNQTTLTCQASGEPAPSIQWTIRPLSGGSSNIQKQFGNNNTTLTLPGLTESVIATCIATNPFGQVQATSSVIYIPVIFPSRKRSIH